MILAEDVGGTKVNLALFDIKKGVPSLSVERSYVSRSYPDLVHLLEHFLEETQPRLTHACLGVAGPVHEGRFQIAPEIPPLLKSHLFLEAFRDKRKFRGFMEQISVKVVMNKRAPLLGAAYFALGENKIQ